MKSNRPTSINPMTSKSRIGKTRANSTMDCALVFFLRGFLNIRLSMPTPDFEFLEQSRMNKLRTLLPADWVPYIIMKSKHVAYEAFGVQAQQYNLIIPGRRGRVNGWVDFVSQLELFIHENRTIGTADWGKREYNIFPNFQICKER